MQIPLVVSEAVKAASAHLTALSVDQPEAAEQTPAASLYALVRAHLEQTPQGQDLLESIQQEPDSAPVQALLARALTRTAAEDAQFAAELERRVADMADQIRVETPQASSVTVQLGQRARIRGTNIAGGNIIHNRRVRIGLGGLVLLLLAGGGYGTYQAVAGDDQSPAPRGAAPGGQNEAHTGKKVPQAPRLPVPAGAWLLHVSWGNSSEDTDHQSYATYVPSTGELALSPAVFDSGSGHPDTPLVVSADYQRALEEPYVPYSQQDAGVLTIHNLATARPEELDVREATKNYGLRPVRAAFSGTDPDRLHVLAKDGGIWTIDLGTGRGTRTGTTKLRTEGDPYPAEAEEGELAVFNPIGDGTIVGAVHAAKHLPGGAEQLSHDTGGYPPLPSAGAGGADLVRLRGGETWAFNSEGSSEGQRLRVYRLTKGPGAGKWERLRGDPPKSPTGEYLQVDWVRPPLH